MVKALKHSLILGCIIFLFCGYTLSPLHNGVSHNVSFGVKIGILPTGGLTQFAVFYYKNGRQQGFQPISLDELIKIATGKWPVPRTSKFHDFFAEQGIYDKNDNEINYRAAFDSLWKIRFPVHPYDSKKGEGWSQGDARPSLKQQAYIYNTYGVRGYDQDYFTDSSFYKLLRDVVDPEWIKHYKSLK